MHPRALAGLLLAVAMLLGEARAVASPTSEFSAPYAVQVLNGGEIVEISGSFSWQLPQNFIAVLARTPNARLVQLESPGGLIRPALMIAREIEARGLDTYVGRLCASACTIAYLGGHQRFLAPGARLGFHQASAPGQAPSLFDPMMREVYGHYHVPRAFIDHVLQTPPKDVWFPEAAELRTAGFFTGPPPADLVTADLVTPDLVTPAPRTQPAWGEVPKLLKSATARP